MTAARVRRGRRTEHVLAGYLREHGFPYAEAAPAFAPGRDLRGIVGWSIECKARGEFRPTTWVKEAASRPGLPVAVLRPNGTGEDAARFLAVLPVGVLVDLMRQAGYGEPLPGLAAVIDG